MNESGTADILSPDPALNGNTLGTSSAGGDSGTRSDTLGSSGIGGVGSNKPSNVQTLGTGVSVDRDQWMAMAKHVSQTLKREKTKLLIARDSKAADSALPIPEPATPNRPTGLAGLFPSPDVKSAPDGDAALKPAVGTAQAQPIAIGSDANGAAKPPPPLIVDSSGPAIAVAISSELELDWSCPMEEVRTRLQLPTDAGFENRGLTEAEAKARALKWGPNRLAVCVLRSAMV